MSILHGVESWTIDTPKTYHYSQQASNIKEVKNFGGGIQAPIGGAAFCIVGAAHSCFAYHSATGAVPIYLLLGSTFMHVSNSYFAIKEFAETHGFKVKDITQAKEGVAYHVSRRGLKRYILDTVKYSSYPEHTLATAAETTLGLLVEAAGFLKGKKVLTPISGGTDGLLTALALQLAGVEQLCVCVGRTEEDFDPSYARKYAEQLGLDYLFLPLPTENDELGYLLERTLQNIEMVDFSNVLMGMCNTLIAELAISKNLDFVMTADIADVILGNDIFSYGSFKKDNPNQTAGGWAEYRLTTGMRTLPNNLQIWKAYNFCGIPTAQLFNDRTVAEFLLSLSLELTPPNGKKPIYYEILNGHIKDGSWLTHGKKWGFYSGSGIGKIRLDNPVLQDANIRKVYSKLIKELA